VPRALIDAADKKPISSSSFFPRPNFDPVFLFSRVVKFLDNPVAPCFDVAGLGFRRG